MERDFCILIHTVIMLLYPPLNEVESGYTGFTLSVRPSPHCSPCYSPHYGWDAENWECGNILRVISALRLKCGYNVEISPYSWPNTPIRIFSAFPLHFFPNKNAQISPRSCPNTPICIFSAFPPHFFPYKNAEISSRSCPNTPIRIFSARKMQRSGVRGLKKSTLVPVRAWCQKDGKPLPQPKFTKIPDVIWHHLATISLLISPLVPHYRGGRSWRELTHWGLVVEIWVTIGSGNGLLPDGTKPLPEPMLTYQ